MSALAPIGRVLFSLVFILSAPHLFLHGPAAAESAGLPMAHVLVPLAGVLALLGGLSVAVGFHARLGALALVAFLIPVTLVMHRFWGLDDAQLAQAQMTQFIKNVALLGAATYLVYAGAGAHSFDARARHTALREHPAVG